MELEVESVDGNFVLPCVVLQGSSEERLGEEETRDPETGWSPVVYPFLHELQPLNKVINPASQRFQ